ncbi:uncharacterized protein CEXT_341411 [Caerostris extrusa]|uniref:Pre-C2HC domain-containing protein n=1 Tax=Caerostris extrusa TaxID=172846 RepID=A0AAV4NFK5_CAEEX|nr:uncharacterized protein CEXT_341411 [Caerostris extrusa]
MDDVQSRNSMISSNNNYFKSSKSINELVLRLGQKSFEEIHIICQHRDAKHKIPRSNPFLIQADIKKHINRHDNITNMKFSRQDKLIFSTADPVCAAQILNLEKFKKRPFLRSPTVFALFTHATRVCDKKICPLCGVNHEGHCQGPEKCILCNGPHSATSKICPRHTHEQKILEFKCRNHLTIGEARRLYTQSSKSHYSDAAKINTTALNIEEIVNQRVESIVQNITTKMEQQTTLLIEIFQKTIENLVQYLVSVFHQTDLNKSPNRKRQMINIVPPTNNPMQWDAGGSNASN